VVEGVAALVPQELRAPLGRAALHLHHLVQLERLESRVGEVEGQGDRGHAVRAEPFVAEVAGRPQAEAARLELGVEALHARLELAARDAQVEIADAYAEELVVLQGRPGGIHALAMIPRADARSRVVHDGLCSG